MFDDQYHSLMHANRQLEKTLNHFQHVSIQNSDTHQFVNDSILEMCDYFGLKKETKYLVKKSLDMYVLKFAWLGPEEISLAAINFLLMAVKFNEDPDLYQKLTIKWYLENFKSESNPYEIQDFVAFQLEIYNLPEFSLNFTTPYDYLGLLTSTFLLNDKMVKKIKNVLDFSFTIPELIFSSAEELYFGSMLMVYKEKNMEIQWILSQTFFRQKVEKVAQVIKGQYQKEVELAMNEPSEQ